MDNRPQVQLTRVSQISINAKDLNRAEGFYKSVLGLKHLFSPPGMAFFDCGGVRLMLAKAEKPELDHPSSIVYFQVPEIKAAHTLLESSGVQFEAKPHLVARLPQADLWMAFFKDSEGNLLALTSEVARAG
jgi:predicted enzyme related to lactoylglutathione lyase